MSDPVTIALAALELGVSPSTLRRWLAAGAPVSRRGGRGRGRNTLVAPDAVRAWRRGGDADDAVMRGRIPEQVASACWQAFTLMDGPFKRPGAGVLAGVWFLVTCEILGDEPEHLPEKIERLYKIGQQ